MPRARTRSAVASAGQLFDLAVVEEDRRARAVLHEDLREVAASPKSLMQHPFEDGCLDEVDRRAVGEGHVSVRQNFRPSMPPSTPPATPAPALSVLSPRYGASAWARIGKGMLWSQTVPGPVNTTTW